MKTLLNKKIIAGILFTVMITTGWSQQLPDSLIKYLEISAKNNPVVMQRFSEYQAALQKAPQARSLPDPELSLGFFLKPMELVNGKQAADIRLMQMFPWFGVLKSAGDEMSLMAKAKFELFRDIRLQVYYDVQRTWYELYKIRKEIDISQKNIEILKTIERLATVRFQVAPSSVTISMQNMALPNSPGLSGLADLYRIQIETAEIQNSISLLKDKYNKVVVQFNSYLNRPPETSVFVADSLLFDTLAITLFKVSDTAFAANPLLNMVEFEKQSLDARGKMIKSMGFPKIGIGLNYSLIGSNDMLVSAMNGKDMIMPMVSVTLPVYRKKYRAMSSEVELLKTATSNNYNAVINSLQTQYYEAVQLYKDAFRRTSLYANQSELAKKSLDLMIKAFSVSSTPLTDLLQIRRQILDYELKQAEAIADLNTSAALLKRLTASTQFFNQ